MTDAAAVCIARFAALEADVSQRRPARGRSGVQRALPAPRWRAARPDRPRDPGGRVARASVPSGPSAPATRRRWRPTRSPTCRCGSSTPTSSGTRSCRRATASRAPWRRRRGRCAGSTSSGSRLLVELGLAGDAHRFAKGHVSPLSRSIRGLSTVGVALALTERGGRYDRLVAGGRDARAATRGAASAGPATVLADAESPARRPRPGSTVGDAEASSPRRSPSAPVTSAIAAAVRRSRTVRPPARRPRPRRRSPTGSGSACAWPRSASPRARCRRSPAACARRSRPARRRPTTARPASTRGAPSGRRTMRASHAASSCACTVPWTWTTS